MDFTAGLLALMNKNNKVNVNEEEVMLPITTENGGCLIRIVISSPITSRNPGKVWGPCRIAIISVQWKRDTITQLLARSFNAYLSYIVKVSTVNVKLGCLAAFGCWSAHGSPLSNVQEKWGRERPVLVQSTLGMLYQSWLWYSGGWIVLDLTAFQVIFGLRSCFTDW